MSILFPKPMFYQYRLELDGKVEYRDYPKRFVNIKVAKNYFESLGYKNVSIEYCGCYKL